VSDKIEKVFSVAVPVERAWAAFTDSAERSKWEAAVYEIDPVPGGKVRWELPGIVSEGVVTEVEHLQRLQHVEGSGPHAQTEITVTFVELGGATTITVTHSGFGTPGVDDWFEGTSLGWDQAIADLCCYLTTGVTPRRFNDGMRSPGMFTIDTPAGAVVRDVRPSGLATDAGLRAGDLILRVNDVAIYGTSDIWVMMRQLPEGERVAVEYVRDSAVQKGTGLLGTW
jgi:uncharacterized protein YndB with AHSA1/START domain